MIQKNLMISLLFLFFSTYLQAKEIEVDYKATFGVFGNVGTIKNKLTQNKNNYTIETTVILAGMANMIMRGQKEHYISKGHMENGLMISDFYEMNSTKRDKKKVKTYTIDHNNSSITKRYRKWKNGTLVKDETQKLDFYSKEDLLTFYFNMNSNIKEKEKGKNYIFKVVGLEKQKGKVEITVPENLNISSYKKDLGNSADWYIKALIVQENFRNKEGDILLSVSKDGFIKKAVIKDILMYGDAQLSRVK